ncbi:hypothetical protein CEXT_310541 [Caerostris extrusa]|uniref:Uncharacterized protein n=1 Tax=Caerostris extrusa TaxID=172846 RepID=A0AAV4V031_CAEEX|nr:hypothetical protein CEXT_310541 [Caerostris extrusa]
MRLVHAVASHYKPDTVLNPPRAIQRKEETKSVKKSCKVSPLQNPSNLAPQRLNSKSEPSSLNEGFLLSESFVEQLLTDVREAKRQLILLQETISDHLDLINHLIIEARRGVSVICHLKVQQDFKANNHELMPQKKLRLLECEAS